MASQGGFNSFVDRPCCKRHDAGSQQNSSHTSQPIVAIRRIPLTLPPRHASTCNDDAGRLQASRPTICLRSLVFGGQVGGVENFLDKFEKINLSQLIRQHEAGVS